MSEAAGEPILRARGLAKTYDDGRLRHRVFGDVDLDVQPAERISIIGASGIGKSTLLHLLGGLDLPSAGEVWVAGQRMNGLSDRARGTLRNRSLGFVYQFHHLLREFTAVENVAMPLLIRRVPARRAQQEAAELLARVGLGARLQHKPGELSGGERQRVAVARALVTRPACVLADEPTGNLDPDAAESVFQMMLELNRELRTALVLVTHDPRLSGRLERTYELRPDGLHAASAPATTTAG
jgi:lipoprotein releasing system, ATP-binding protein